MEKNRYIESNTETYMSAIIEQEIPTKYMQKKRSKNTLMGDKCRLCKSNVEDIHHIAVVVHSYHLDIICLSNATS